MSLEDRYGYSLLIPGWLFYAPFAAILALALLLPTHGFSYVGFVQAYTSFFETIVPGIHSMAEVSAFPGVTKLVLCIGYSLLIIEAPLIVKHIRFNVEVLRTRSSETIVTVLTILGTLAFLVVAPSAITPDELQGSTFGDRVLRGVSMSTVWLGVVVGGACPAMAAMGAFLFAVARRARHIFVH